MQAVTESPTSGMHPQDISQVLFATSGLCVCVWLLHLFVPAFITIGSCKHTCFSLSVQSEEILRREMFLQDLRYWQYAIFLLISMMNFNHVQVEVIKRAAELDPNIWWRIKGDGVDVVKGIKELTRGE